MTHDTQSTEQLTNVTVISMPKGAYLVTAQRMREGFTVPEGVLLAKFGSLKTADEFAEAWQNTRNEAAEQQMDSESCTCGTCELTFPDLYPSARCPFEYFHSEMRG